ncbi:hypothetical protein PE066_18005 [Ramlibacter tataouinensis]|uniref:hypothetical protein n=1 Tax=Ramlibacter tataouinensis TaxID=94132 RepID=UPI0022F3BE2E|nr:hypothetical protein [Ramlibacter tataouinensis]WBY01335.1 hypothetical protein PE066_18005 [Ramlibacter tataouinensis]
MQARTFQEAPPPGTAQWAAVANWYHAYFTGLLMTMVSRKGAREAAELTYHIFRRQHLERFLPGLEKLGLTGLPPAVTAARYHYLSNAIGGVRVEYLEETPQKVWVRYPPPRWAWHGTAICAIPGEVSRAVLRGWHAHNGVTLGSRRLGFVCTKQTVDGQPGLEGYYCEYDRDIEPDERLRFERGVEMPDVDPASMPVLPTADWPQERLQKARRNYAMEYVRTALPELIALHGPHEAEYLGGITARLIGMQFYSETAAAFGVPDHGDAGDFARFMVMLARAQGDSAELVESPQGVGVRQTSWKLMAGLPSLHGAAFQMWNQLLEGALSAHNRRLQLELTRRRDLGDEAFEWRIARRLRGSLASAS